MMLAAGQGAIAAGEPGTPRERLKTMGLEPTIERLVQYAAQGDTTVVELIAAAGVAVDTAEPTRGATALHNAAAQGHVRLVTRLIDLGASVDAKDFNGATPLTNAAYFGRVDIVRILLAKGARPNVSNVAVTPLIAAVLGGNPGIVDQLIQAGADPAQAGTTGLTAADMAQISGRTALLARLVPPGAKAP
jgi:ankyrin repeat protein